MRPATEATAITRRKDKNPLIADSAGCLRLAGIGGGGGVSGCRASLGLRGVTLDGAYRVLRRSSSRGSSSSLERPLFPLRFEGMWLTVPANSFDRGRRF